jgi:hypothetical protein
VCDTAEALDLSRRSTYGLYIMRVGDPVGLRRLPGVAIGIEIGGDEYG